MSTSPHTNQSTKRPLEETSSPSRTAGQPDAKRPALDKILRNDGDVKDEIGPHGLPAIPPIPMSETNGTKMNGDKPRGRDDHGGATLPDGAEMKRIVNTAGGPGNASGNAANAHDETAWIHIRAVISSPEAATIIGKGGENVSKIRHMSNAKCTVSDYQKGAVERILTVSGVVDSVAKVRRTSAADPRPHMANPPPPL